MNKPIAIIGALDIEIEEYVNHLEHGQKRVWKEFIFYEGVLCGKQVVIVKSGVGKVFAALTTQKLIDEYEPSHILFSGVAGGINDSYQIGDVVIAEDCIQHDLDATELGVPRGTVPYTNYSYFKSDSTLLNLALSANLEHSIFKGRILTGDQFLTKRELKEFEYLRSELHGDAVEMEGAAVALVSTVNEIPFLIIRTISDKANEEASIDFETFLPEVARNSFLMVKHILSRYA